MENEWFSEDDKDKFKETVKTQISQHKLLNAMYSKYNLELFKVLIDINLEHIELLEMLIAD